MTPSAKTTSAISSSPTAAAMNDRRTTSTRNPSGARRRHEAALRGTYLRERSHPHAQMTRLQVGPQPLRAQLAPEAAELPPAERRLQVGGVVDVDPDRTRLHPLGERPRALEVLAVHICREPVGPGVGGREQRPVVGRLVHGGDRPERLLGHDAGAERHVVNHRRREECAAVEAVAAERLAANDHPPTAAARSRTASPSTGPYSTSASTPWPIRMVSTVPRSASTNSPCTRRSTRMRLTAMQIWPMFENERRAAARAASSTSASPSTTNGVWPPSSSESRLMSSDAARMIARPVAVEAVAVTSRTPGCETSRSPVPAPGPGRSASTPAGTPASTSS